MKGTSERSILIIEDDFLVAEEIKRHLVKLHYTKIHDASDGKSGVRLACEICPDVILMDIQMPGFSGLEASRQIQENCPTPIVILTAYDSDELIDAAGKVGVGAFLTKPPKTAELNRAITIAIARHKDLMALKRLNEELETALAEIKTLQGILPICSYCKSVRDDKDSWHQIENYIRRNSDVEFSHGICPDCLKKLYADLDK